MPIRPSRRPAATTLSATLCVAMLCIAGPLRASQASADAAGPLACAAPAERAQVRVKRVGASWEVSIRSGGWRPLTRLAKKPLGLQRSPDGAYVAYVDRDFRPDGVLVIQRLADGQAFTGELNALPKALCFSADGDAVLLEAEGGQRSPVALSAVPGGSE